MPPRFRLLTSGSRKVSVSVSRVSNKFGTHPRLRQRRHRSIRCRLPVPPSGYGWNRIEWKVRRRSMTDLLSFRCKKTDPHRPTMRGLCGTPPDPCGTCAEWRLPPASADRRWLTRFDKRARRRVSFHHILHTASIDDTPCDHCSQGPGFVIIAKRPRCPSLERFVPAQAR